MATITNQEHQFNGDLTEGETVALYVNGQKFKEYTVTAGSTAKVVFNYQEKTV